MKKIMTIAFTTLFMLVCIVAVSQPKNTEKSDWKLAKKQAKIFKKEGYKVDGSKPMENMLYDHYRKLHASESNQEIQGDVIGQTSVKTINQAQQWSMTNAAIKYSKQDRIFLRGRIAAEFGAGVAEHPSMDNFYEAYEGLVQKEIRGEVKKTVGMYKEKKEGGIDYKGFYIVDEEGASNARIKALEMAFRESEVARENAEKISEFVQKGFEISDK